MANNSFFEHKDYPTIMFLGLIIVSMIVLFSFVDFVDEVNKGFTAYVVQQQNVPEYSVGAVNISEAEIGEVYTIQAWSIFYVVLIVVIVLVVFLFVILKRTIEKNMEEEEKGGGFIG